LSDCLGSASSLQDCSPAAPSQTLHTTHPILRSAPAPRDLTPHPQYAAFYKWLQHEYAADVVLHFGMHGTVEVRGAARLGRRQVFGSRQTRLWAGGVHKAGGACFLPPALDDPRPVARPTPPPPPPPARQWLPGSPLGNTGFSWSDVLLGNMPNVYVYAANNPSESIIAKRRGYGTIVSHNVPPYGRAGAPGAPARLHAPAPPAAPGAGGRGGPVPNGAGGSG
jgi:hypothetical protein